MSYYRIPECLINRDNVKVIQTTSYEFSCGELQFGAISGIEVILSNEIGKELKNWPRLKKDAMLKSMKNHISLFKYEPIDYKLIDVIYSIVGTTLRQTY